MPSLENLNQHFRGKDFVVLGIDKEEDRDTVSKYVQQYGLSFDNVLDENGQVSVLYGVQSTPMKFIIDTKGNIAGVALGYREWDGEKMKSLIQKLIEAG